MNKRKFLNTYKKIDAIDSPKQKEANEKKIYQSEHDERLIKDFHYAKFQKNLNATQQSKEFKALIEKEEWDEADIEKLLSSLR